MGYVSSGNGYMNIHTLYQQDQDFNNVYVSSRNDFINSHIISQCNDSSTFKDMDGDVEICDVRGGNDYMNSHNIYQHNSLKPLINLSHRDGIEMNTDLKNGDVSCGVGLIKNWL